MTQEGFKRKLTAILSADAVGYSRLMAEDEAATVKTIATYREVMTSLIKQHRGRVVDSPGDNLLAEFSSVVDAVQCAVAVQNEFQIRNAELAENRRMEFRIGINLGDVIDEEDRIYGDGVNIAARLEALADPGGICVSKTAFDQIETKLPLGYEYLGEQPVKNIPKPVGAYRVLMQPRVTVAGKIEKEKPASMRRKTIIVGAVVVLMVVIGFWQFYIRRPSVEPVSVEKMAYPLPDKPSIAVLPFANMTGDPDQEYFCDGITEEIITALSKTPKMLVIARNSTFTYKGKPVKVQVVAEEMGVRYVLEGSVRIAGEQVRITAQLIDAVKGYHLWAERYDRDMKDVFAVQDEITMKIITALQVKLTEGEQARFHSRGAKNLAAYLKWLEGLTYLRQFSREKNVAARQIAEEVIRMDPEDMRGYSLLAYTNLYDVWLGLSRSPKESFSNAIELAQKAIDLDPINAEPYMILAHTYVLMRRYDAAIAEAEKALEMQPGSADSHATLGHVLLLSGRHKEAVIILEKATRLNPYPPSWYYLNLASAYNRSGRHEEAVNTFKKSIENAPNNPLALVGLTIALVQTNRIEEARATAKDLLRVNPKFTIEQYVKRSISKDKTRNNKNAEALRKAGLK
ncbi:MAG: tetratricopeptide repeat protein [Deltaproteobacteria bacterium]|nr:tetratricopeptide repeat protein [Deltaproteobacteria bacterium]